VPIVLPGKRACVRVLLTNDDGVEAPGLWALHEAVEQLGEVIVVAPASEQSGVGHAITYRTPITARQLEAQGPAWAVDGTPADCVKFALLHLLEEPPDLILSGVNVGLNLGCNVFYSGTVAAALEGAMYGILAVAISTCPSNASQLDRAAAQACRAIRLILQGGRGGALAYNVNIPALVDGEPRLRFTSHRAVAFRERYLPEELDGGTAYRLHLPTDEVEDTHELSDVRAVREGAISLTPMRASLTDSEALRRLSTERQDASPTVEMKENER